jgi:23S rRNA (adenine2503-C2)-methyltransferase
MSTFLCGMTSDDFYESVSIVGFTRIQAEKVLTSFYRKGVRKLSSVKDIPKSLKEMLLRDFSTGHYSPFDLRKSLDGSVKYLFRNEDGLVFETVYLPDNKRKTVCVSTQSGCRMGCSFCLTGRSGYSGNASARDIINQVISMPDAAQITHVVFMGMGEPMDNVEDVLKACRIITSEWGLSLSSRNITVSTVGIPAGIKEFLERSDCNLTLSLHSPFPEERQLFVPVEKKYPFTEILNMMNKHEIRKKRRLSVAYIMIKDVNDTDHHLAELKKLLSGSVIRVNLLPFHHIENEPYCSSTAERMQFFKHHLVVSGISASIRKSRGEDISAACGLLASNLTKPAI